MRGNCYFASEALYHILGGKRAGWKPMVMRLSHWQGKPVPKSWTHNTHWFLLHKSGLVLDPSRKQFGPRWFDKPDYSKARGCGYLTGPPSNRARLLMSRLTWWSEL